MMKTPETKYMSVLVWGFFLILVILLAGYLFALPRMGHDAVMIGWSFIIFPIVAIGVLTIALLVPLYYVQPRDKYYR